MKAKENICIIWLYEKKYSNMFIREMLFDNEYISYVYMISVDIHVYGISLYNI